MWESSDIEFALKIALNLGVALQQAELLAESQRRSTALQSALGEVEAQKDYLARIAEEERALTRVIEGIRQTLELQNIFQPPVMRCVIYSVVTGCWSIALIRTGVGNLSMSRWPKCGNH
ncbi:hypothetical protein NON20_18280 [Synechocystis sp. B12]|nr:hypothetical protein NON20_18280 [Synechocystis sp. B12]